MDFLTNPYYFSLCLYIIGLFSFPIHLFGAYCILFQTPSTMKHVKWVMFNLHFWNCWLDLTISVFSQPFIIPPVFGGYFLGILTTIGVDTKIQVYIMVTLLMMVAISIIAIFENRFFLVFAENTWWRYGRILFYLISYGLALLYFVPTVIQIPDQDLARREIFKMYPQVIHFDSPAHPIYVVAYETEIREYIGYRQLISLGTVIIEGSTFLILLHYNIHVSIKKMTLSQNTLRIQKTFLKAVYMQIAIPAIVMILPQILMNLLGYLYRNSPEINSLSYMLMSIHGASATLIMLYFHAPYQEFCGKLMCKKLYNPKIDVSSSMTTGVDMTPI
ncbi:unnamed protein product [Caenorhabditis brenneri]